MEKRTVPISTSSNSLNLNNLGSILTTSIQSAIHTVVIIGGFVVLFSVIVSMLNSSQILDILCSFLEVLNIPTTYSEGIITGLIEVTNGVKLSAINTNPFSIITCSFLLGFGGISVLLQVLSFTSEAKISIKPYILGKLLQATLSAIIMYFWLM